MLRSLTRRFLVEFPLRLSLDAILFNESQSEFVVTVGRRMSKWEPFSVTIYKSKSVDKNMSAVENILSV